MPIAIGTAWLEEGMDCTLKPQMQTYGGTIMLDEKKTDLQY